MTTSHVPPHLTSPVPPHFVPTLTEVVAPSEFTESGFTNPIPVQAVCGASENQTMQRVLKRIDLDLERQLPAAVNQEIVNHMQLLMPRLCEEINEVVQQCVIRAFEDEAALGRQRDVKT